MNCNKNDFKCKKYNEIKAWEYIKEEEEDVGAKYNGRM